MSNQGFWTTDLEGTADRFNATLLQYDTFANRPAASRLGRRFYATDTHRLYRDNGASWDLVIGADEAAATPSQRSLGTGATQAAVGNHAHTNLSSVAWSITDAPGTGTGITANTIGALTLAYGNAQTKTHTPSSLLSATVIYASATYGGAWNYTVTMHILVDGVEEVALGAAIPGTGDTTQISYPVSKLGLSLALHTYAIESKVSSVANPTYLISQSIGYAENKWS